MGYGLVGFLKEKGGKWTEKIYSRKSTKAIKSRKRANYENNLYEMNAEEGEVAKENPQEKQCRTGQCVD